MGGLGLCVLGICTFSRSPERLFWVTRPVTHSSSQSHYLKHQGCRTALAPHPRAKPVSSQQPMSELQALPLFKNRTSQKVWVWPSSRPSSPFRDSPVSLTESRDAGQALVTGGVILSIWRAGVGDGCALVFLIAFLCCFFLSLGQLVILSVKEQWLMLKRLLGTQEDVDLITSLCANMTDI